jgi:hypothetical protein
VFPARSFSRSSAPPGSVLARLPLARRRSRCGAVFPPLVVIFPLCSFLFLSSSPGFPRRRSAVIFGSRGQGFLVPALGLQIPRARARRSRFHGWLTLSMWFYDTFIDVAIGVVYYDFFVGGTQIAQGVGYQRIRWTRGFTWFRSPERNTLRPRENVVVLLCLSARLRSSFLCVCLLGPFIAQGRAVTVRPHDPTGGPGAGRPLRS